MSQARVGLLFNANKAYDRQVMAGISRFCKEYKPDWDIVVSDDYRSNLDSKTLDRCTAFIADFDDPGIENSLQESEKLIVGVGSSYNNSCDYPSVPYVATDNVAIVSLALQHFLTLGLPRVAFYGMPSSQDSRWAIQREQAMLMITKESDIPCYTFRGTHTHIDEISSDLCNWISSLPKPIGILASNDRRARQLIAACHQLNEKVPEEISVLGIDDDELANFFCKPELSSIRQNTEEMGFIAGKKLYQLLVNKEQGYITQTLVKPAGLIQRESTAFNDIQDIYVRTAVGLIHRNLHTGIRAGNVIRTTGISRSSMDDRFLSEMGMSLHKYIAHIQFKKAKDRLKESEISISRIAELCGYPSTQYMYAVFNKNIGITPSQYRTNHLYDGG